MNDDLCEIIAAIIQERKDNYKEPSHAMISDIVQRYRGDDLISELDALEAIGLIKSGPTINSTYYVIN